MRRYVLGAFAVLFAALAGLAAPSRCQAQAFWGGEIERALRPGAYVPYDGMPYMQRYNYEYGPGFYLGVSPQRIYTLDYLDRLDRASTIGLKYQSPWNPNGKVPLFNRLRGEEIIMDGPAPIPYHGTPMAPPRVQFGAGVGYFFGR